MRLYLSSFRIGDHPEALQRLTGSGRRALVVANAADAASAADRAERVAAELDALTGLGYHARELDLRTVGGPGELEKTLRGVDLLWLRGGNVFVLREQLARTGLDRLIIEALDRDGFVVGGYSAGPCVLGSSLAGLERCDAVADLAVVGPDARPRFDGLGVLDVTVVPHVDSVHPESAVLTELAADLAAEGRPLLTLRDGDVWVRDGDIEVLLPRR